MASLHSARHGKFFSVLSLLSLLLCIISVAAAERERHKRDEATVPRPPTHQNPQVAPPVPIGQLSLQYIEAASQDLSTHSNGTFEKRGALLCGPGQECPDKSCCGTNGKCGFGPTYCGKGNCTSNCDALAMCGQYSDLGGTIKCGMNTCCSLYGWCGTDEAHCGADERGNSNCQKGFGSCQIYGAPSCGGGSTNGRTVAYYQANNLIDRACNKITPSQIDTTGLTHLNFAFAKFDPKTFAIVPGNPMHVDLYREFTALNKKNNLKTWIAIGGFDFSDAKESTHTAWSNMTAFPETRAAFIKSLGDFMALYGFQGVDLDWEYPGTPERGGQRADTENLVSLVKEMRHAYGSTYGISLTLAPDYWYLRWFNAIDMQSSVDFFGFMAYDLHGSWDSDVKTLTPTVRGQADIREIANDTLPLWFDKLDPAKINFGLAYYGRGYKLANPSCNTLDCPFAGPSAPGRCTNSIGVLSLREIEQVIQEKGIKPTLLPQAMMKQITWDDQWIGYDDAETHKLKRAWADSRCFGGVMYWSIDFYSVATPPQTRLTEPVAMQTGAKSVAIGLRATVARPQVSAGLMTLIAAMDAKAAIAKWEGRPRMALVALASLTLTVVTGHWGHAAPLPDSVGTLQRIVEMGVRVAVQQRTVLVVRLITTTHVKDSLREAAAAQVAIAVLDQHFVVQAVRMVIATTMLRIRQQTVPAARRKASSVVTGRKVPAAARQVTAVLLKHIVALVAMVLPPQTLSSTSTITPPPATETFEETFPTTSNGITSYTTTTKTTVIPIPVILITVITYYDFNWTLTDTSTQVTVTRSIIPPPITITESSNSIGPGFTWTYSPSPVRQTDHPVPIVIIRDFPDPVCKGPFCPKPCTENCDPNIRPPHFGLPCIGPGCKPPNFCLGLFCPPGSGGPGGGGGSSGPGGGPPNHGDCATKTTVSDCEVVCSTTATTAVPSCTTSCVGILACKGTGTTTTVHKFSNQPASIADGLSGGWYRNRHVDNGGNLLEYLQAKAYAQAIFRDITVTSMPNRPSTTAPPSSTTHAPNTNFISCSHRDQNPGEGINTAYCVCSGSTFAESVATIVTPANSCAYTTMPGSTLGQTTGFPASTNTDTCQVCTQIGPNQQDCTTLSNCTPKPTTPPSSPSTRCITAHIYEMNCAFGGDGMKVQLWDNGVLTCDTGSGKTGASSDSKWTMDCGNGNSLEVTNDGADLVYTANDGSISLSHSDGHHDTPQCGGTDENPIKGFQFEYVFDNGQCANCNVATLCDYRNYCPKFDGSCH
ncbi:glycoside hydrolase family 18 protein [Myriangium duriaei CBS 260.36]|uniref:chitinase n=1 Tax=Myriangium duriaei CBS 260.36 TaxID=1168546 RepID=A0A9P4J4D0_9PEZI|nr:glycoside hydrolase family 18 protein [Myriangium duriaei CBS 260.36]